MKFTGITRSAASVGAGAVVFALSMNMFLLPGEIVVGGMTGVATVLRHFFGLSTGFWILLLNLPLMYAGAKRFGRGFFVRTLIGTGASSLALELIPAPILFTDPLTCSVTGGLMMGLSLGMMLRSDYTTGGTDLVACLLSLRYRDLPLGSLIMLSDLAVILGGALLLREPEGIGWSAFSLAVTGKTTDLLLRSRKGAVQRSASGAALK